MASSKLIRIEEEIDKCRCHGDWPRLPKLAKKYSKYISSSVLEPLILGEHSLNINLNLRRKPVAYDSDSPSHLSYDPPIPKDSLTEAQNFLKKAIENGNTQNNQVNPNYKPYLQQASILLARSYLEIGETDESLNILNKIELENQEILNSNTSYSKIGIIMGWTIKGLSYELLEQKQQAIKCYNNVVSIVEKNIVSHPLTYTNTDNSSTNEFPVPSGPERSNSIVSSRRSQDIGGTSENINEQWIDWSEEALYRVGLLTYSIGEMAEAEKIFKLYNTVISLCKELTPNKKNKPIPINKTLIHLLLKPYSNVNPPVRGIPKYTSDYFIPQALYRDLYALLTNYEELVCKCQQFPRGEDATRLECERNARIIECYEYWTIVECGGNERKTEAEILERKKKLLEILYRGTRHTFHSLAILRWISHTFTYMIVNFGDTLSKEDKKEAMSVISQYIEQFNKIFANLKTTERKKQEELEAMVTTPYSKKRESIMSQDAWGSPTDDSPLSSLVIKNVEGESLTDMIGVVIAGVRVALEVAEGDINIISTAMKNVDSALKLYNLHGENLADYKQTLVKLLQYRGIIYGELALEVRNTQLRNEYSTVAVNSFELCIRYDKKQWEVYYQLALQKAEMLEIATAIEYLNRAITINPNNIPSWNLLALLCSAQGNYAQALKVCEIGWKTTITKLTQIQTMQVNEAAKAGADKGFAPNTDSLSALESLKTKSKFRWDLVSRVNREELISFKITHFLLHVEYYGAQESIKLLQSLFSLYMKLFVSNGIPGVGEVVAPEINDYSSIKRNDLINNNIPMSNLYDNNIDMNSYSVQYNGVRNIDSLSFSVYTSNHAQNYSPYRFRQLDLLITLWIISSNLSRKLGAYNEAYKAIVEAKRLSQIMGHIEYQNRNKGSGIFINNSKKYENVYPQIKSSATALSLNNQSIISETNSIKSSKSKIYNGDNVNDNATTDTSPNLRTHRRTNSTKSAISFLGIAFSENQKSDSPWEMASHRMRRVIADLEFEKTQIQYDQYNDYKSKKQKSQKVFEKYIRSSELLNINLDDILKKLEDEENEKRRISLKKNDIYVGESRKNSVLSNGSTDVNSKMDTITEDQKKIEEESNEVQDEEGKEVEEISNKVDGMNIKEKSELGDDEKPGVSEKKIEGAENSESVEKKPEIIITSSNTEEDKSVLEKKGTENTINGKPSLYPKKSREETKAEDEEDEEIDPKNITIDSLIDQLNNISIIDDDHLPTRVFLGQLYYQKKNYELAEYWLQRSVKNNKNRGSNGGKSGETTYFGGVTGVWGWEGWHWLGMSYSESDMGKEEQAIQCLQYAVDLEHRSQFRGFECISKFCPIE